MTHEYSKEDLIRMGRSELRAAHGLNNDSEISDEFLVEQIEAFADEVYAEVGYEPDLGPGTPGYDAVRFYGLIRAAYFLSPETGPTSISHARRFDYEDDQTLIHWRNRLVRALSTL
ncbi:hypothetical protein DJ70_12800 [Halorubrum halodurans]|uniref:Uncharacterized protein n=1 Tax=Halorubrum halodurans TaxID=1383851 RepID=A0A256IFJ0_9EURY|nr:hypothetical protein DJ70_12800 [Halorubrum halodurans]